MNKRGFIYFIPFFTVIVALTFVVLATAMQQNNRDRIAQDNVGQQALALLKVADESDRAVLFMEYAMQHASDEAQKRLAKSGGYGSQNTCQKLLSDPSVVIWNTCGAFNPRKSFDAELDNALTKELEAYTSTYQAFSAEDVHGDKGIEVNLRDFFADRVRTAKIEKGEWRSEKGVVTLTPMVYIPELAPAGTRYTRTPQLSVQREDMDRYDAVFNKVQECNGKTGPACVELLERGFAGIVVSSEAEFVKVILPLKSGTLQFAFDPKKPLPFAQHEFSMLRG